VHALCSGVDEPRVLRILQRRPYLRGSGQECRIIAFLMDSLAMDVSFALQCFHVLFLALHDWIPLGALNDLRAVRSANPGGKLAAGTIISAIPFAIGLGASALYFGSPYPVWLFWWLWISYCFLFVGELKAWWIPYLFRADPALAARYRVMFGATHAFLPERNGIRLNTLHVILHAATVALLIVLGVLTAQRG
jgi:hypothetical protein